MDSTALVALWKSYLRALLWVPCHLPPTSSTTRSTYVTNASIACLLAAHCSGWFSRPNNDHSGWRDVYAALMENRHTHSSLFLFDCVFGVNALDEIVLSIPPFDETTLYCMLKKDFRPINHSSIVRQRDPQARNRQPRIVINIERPQVWITQFTDM